MAGIREEYETRLKNLSDGFDFQLEISQRKFDEMKNTLS